MKRDNYRHSIGYLVNDEHAFVYFAIPKVASSTIKTALLPLFPGLDPGEDFEREVLDGTFARRAHRLFTTSGYRVNRGQFLRELEQGRYDGYFKFAFVRNPWDRLLSCYSNKLAPGGRGFPRMEYAGERLWVGMSFERFVEAVCRIPDEKANRHFRSQHINVCGNGPSKDVLVDFVGRFENLQTDFAFVADKIGAGAEVRLPHLQRSRDGGAHSYREAYDQRLADLVGERYRLDAEIFGYSF